MEHNFLLSPLLHGFSFRQRCWLPLLLVFLFTFSIVPAARGQEKIWDKIYSRENNSTLYDMVNAPDGGYLLVGDLWIVKINAAGEKQWEKYYEGDFLDLFKAAVATPDGGFLLARNFNQGFETDTNIILIKIDAQGNEQWTKTYGGSADEQVTSIIASSAGGYLIGGYSASGIGGDKSEPNQGGRDYWVIKVDETGEKQWDKTIGGEADDEIAELVEIPTGGYLLAGNSNSDKSGDKSQDYSYENGTATFWAVKIDAQGKKVWDKTLWGTDPEIGIGSMALSGAVATPDGGFLLGGALFIGRVSGKNLIIKIDKDGEKLWEKSYDSGGFSFIKDIILTPDNGFLLGNEADFGKGRDKTEEGFPGNYNIGFGDYWVLRVDELGNRIWDKTFGFTGGDQLTSLLLTGDGNFLLGGTTSSGSTPMSMKRSFYLVKIVAGLKPNQQISVASIPNKVLGDAPFYIEAQSTSGLPVSISVVSGPADLTDNLVTLTGTGTVRIKLSQAGNDTYLPAADVFLTFTVIKKDWEQAFDGNEAESIEAMVAAADGGFLLAGSSLSGISTDKSESNRGGHDYWVVKINDQGTKQWDKTFGGEQEDNLHAAVATPDGGYLLGGTSSSGIDGDKSAANKGGADFWLVKIDAQGNKIWDKTFGGNLGDALFIITPTNDGNYLLGGYSNSDSGGDKTQASKGGFDYWIIKIDENGNKLWDKTLGSNGTDQLRRILANADGSFILAGTSDSNIGGDKTEERLGGNDFWVLKIDAEGNKIWDKTLGTTNSEELQALTYTADAGYLLGGNYIHGDLTSDYYVIKIDQEGNNVWFKTIGGNGPDILQDIVTTPDGGFLLGGYSLSGISGDKTEASDNLDAWIVRLDANAKIIWDKTLVNRDIDELHDILTIGNGNYLLGGRASYLSRKGDTGFWVAKINDPVLALPAPTITSLQPAKGLPGTEVTLKGTDFTGTQAVNFNSVAAVFQVVDNTTIKATVPINATTGVITVVTPSGVGTSPGQFTVLKPEIAFFAPNQGEIGQTVLLVGSNINSTKEVRFNGVATSWFRVYFNYVILAKVPEGATTGKISLLLNGGAQASTATDFTIVATAPVIIAEEKPESKMREVTQSEPSQPVLLPYPNPFTNQVTIPVQLKKATTIKVSIYSELGQRIKEIPVGTLAAGPNKIEWDGKDQAGKPVAQGLYFYRVDINGKLQTGKLQKLEK